MKIGILTYHTPYNFGANLQAFTTCKALEKRGIQAKIIDFKRDGNNTVYRKIVPKEQWPAHDEFIQQKLPLTSPAMTNEDLCKITNEERFDGIIVGADAVWSFASQAEEIPAYFMDWLFSDQKISMIPVAAMSVANMTNGFRHLSKQTLLKLGDCIKRFSHLTVRDDFTRSSINRHIFSGEEIITTLNPDPVFCLGQYLGDDDAFEQSRQISGSPYILYTLPKNLSYMTSWFKKFKKKANKHGYMMIELPLPDGKSGLKGDFSVPFPLDPIQWYQWIIHSSGFLGVRFHSIVSAISGGVPFFSLDTYGKIGLPLLMLNNRLGLYQIGRLFNKQSKIFQLLENTEFRTHRVYGARALAATPPSKVFHKIINTERERIRSLQIANCAAFQNTLDRIVAIFNETKAIPA